MKKAGLDVLYQLLDGEYQLKDSHKKTKADFPPCSFHDGDILDFQIYESIGQDAIVMPEITWYILAKLDAYLDFLRSKMLEVYLLHLLTVYPPGVQKYG